MIFDLKRTRFVLAALLIASYMEFAAPGAVTQGTSAASGSDPKSGSNAEFIAAADEVLHQMSEITGLKLLAPLKKSLRSREEIRAYVIKQMNEEKKPAERYADQRTAEAFGLIPKG